MQAYSELLPPTAVTQAVRISFLGPNSSQLVVAKTSLLQVFEIRSVQPSTYNTTRSGPITPHVSHREQQYGHDSAVPPLQTEFRLVLLAEFPLYGTVTSIVGIKALNTKTGGEALLVSFKDAKVSLVEWDPEVYGLSTISLHYYEGEDLQACPWVPALGQCSSWMTVDPSSRCAVLKFGVRHLAILPFRQLGDDLVMGEYEPDVDDGSTRKPVIETPTTNGNIKHESTPYGSSFVLPLTALDPQLIYPVDLAFLHEYREPTIGVLSSSQAHSSSLLSERKDILSYTVFTLDIEQRARTPLLSVPGLPYDLHTLYPLPSPVGGALLVGGNEVVHVDQSGKTSAIGVNEFAKQCSSYPMTDQSELAMRLESCTVEQLGSTSGDVLMILKTGELAILSFRLDGRSVSGLSIHRVSEVCGGHILRASAICAVLLEQDVMFVGSEDSNSTIIHWNRKTTQLARKRSYADMFGSGEMVSDEESEDEDDLYGNEVVNSRQRTLSGSKDAHPSDYIFSIEDTLPTLIPTGEPAIGRHRNNSQGVYNAVQPTLTSKLDLVIPTGRGNAGAIAVLNRSVCTSLEQDPDIKHVKDLFCVQVVKGSSRELKQSKTTTTGIKDEETEIQLLIASHIPDSGVETSSIHYLTDNSINECKGTDFEMDAVTLNIGTLRGKSRLVQVFNGEVRSYDSDLALGGIFPMVDEATDTELKVIHSHFCDPYLAIIRDDYSALVLQIDEQGDFDELKPGDGLLSTKWVSGCIHLALEKGNNEVSNHKPDNFLLYLLSDDGAMHVFKLSDFSKAEYIAAGLDYLPAILSAGNVPKRLAARHVIVDLSVADIGDTTIAKPFLILRTAEDDVVIYESYHKSQEKSNQSFTEGLQWVKALTLHNTENSEYTPSEANGKLPRSALRAIPDLGGYATVFLPGDSPGFILKEASSPPRLLKLQEKLQTLSPYRLAERAGFVCCDAGGRVSFGHLPQDISYGLTGWAMRHVPLGHEVGGICYHDDSGLYVVGTNQTTKFRLPEDEWHHEWMREEISFKPHVLRGAVNLVDPTAWTIIDTLQFEEDEILTCLKTVDLEVSELTHEHKSLVAATTAFVRGEDINAEGSIYVFEIVKVVPDPARPETNRKLKLIVREEVKGAATALAEIGTQGFLVMAQGQKCMVRGLKEDKSLLPVAFMDAQCYVRVLKNLKGTGLSLMGDAEKGIWFTGFTQEPYKLILFGKSNSHMQVVAAEFLPNEKQLFILVADAESDIHVLEFNPEHPKSLSGQRLLLRSTFHSGHFPVTMSLLPLSKPARPSAAIETNGTANGAEGLQSSFQVLLAMQSGVLALITSLDEQTYSRLGALQTHLTNVLEHACGLNPRVYRAVESEGFGSRGLLDGGLLTRWSELGSQRRAEACARVGAEAWQIEADLERISGGGLEYL